MLALVLVLGLIALGINAIGPVGQQTNNATIPAGYNLVFEDNFNNLSEIKWEIVTSEKYNWLECVTRDNIYVENGNLVTRVKQGYCPSGLPGYNYNAGLAMSKDSWKYGFFEIRAKVAAGKGLNNGFWLIGTDWVWPPEIDIVETAGYDDIPDTIYMSYYNPDNEWKKDIYNGPDFSQDFHIYGMEWTSTSITWYIDGVERYRVTRYDGSIASTHMQVILSMNRGWTDGIDGLPRDEILPKYQYIDYIKIYQKGVAN